MCETSIEATDKSREACLSSSSRVRRRRHYRKRFFFRSSNDVLPVFFSRKYRQRKSSLVCWTCCLIYLCSTTLLNLPVVLLPVIALENTTVAKNDDGKMIVSSSLVASVASVAVFGSAIGKLVNGGICTILGAYKSSFCYLLGLGFCTFWFSIASSQVIPYANAGMEFFASMQWTALSIVLRRAAADQNKEEAHAYFSRGISLMSFASTGGSFATKTIGVFLLQYLDWPKVAKVAALICTMVGVIAITIVSSIMRNDKHSLMDADSSNSDTIKNSLTTNQKNNSQRSVWWNTRYVFSNPLFWIVGLAHGTTMLGRSSDRVLGAFFHSVTELPPRICGGLTISSTLGLVYGLQQHEKEFYKLTGKYSKQQFFYKRYKGAILAVLSLSMSAVCKRILSSSSISYYFQHLFLFPYLQKFFFTSWITISAFLLTFNTAFLFFQIPNMTSIGVFPGSEHQQAIALSALEAVSFSFIAAPLWKLFGILSIQSYEAAFLLLAVAFTIGSKLLQNASWTIL